LSSLALRFHWVMVFLAFALASTIKMLVAGMLGSVVVRSHSHWTYLISAAAFFVSAIMIWVDEPPDATQEMARTGRWFTGAFVCFTSFFLAEWGDPGQIATAALVLQSHLVLATCLGAVLALMVKASAALMIGLQIRKRIPLETLRVLSSASCCLLGILAISQGVMT